MRPLGVAVFLVCCFFPAVYGDDLVPKEGAQQNRGTIRDVVAQSNNGTLWYWRLTAHGPTMTPLYCGSCYRVDFSSPAESASIRGRWQQAGLGLLVVDTNNQELALNNCYFSWELPPGYYYVLGRKPENLNYEAQNFLPESSIRMAGIRTMEFNDFKAEGTVLVSLVAGGSYSTFVSNSATGVNLIPEVHGLTYEKEGEFGNPSKVYFREHTWKLSEVRRITVTYAPSPRDPATITDFKWSQAIVGTARPRVYSSVGSSSAPKVRQQTSFSGEVHGSNFTPGAQLFFCGSDSGLPEDETKCLEPSGSVQIQSQGVLTFDGAILPSGDWHIYVKTQAGRTKSSVRFGVE